MRRHDITFLSGNDRCSGWLYRPDKPEPHALVVLAHGFAGVREARLDAFAERFCQAGLAALVFDYRHFGASEGAPRGLISIPGQIADWRAAVRFARTTAGIDAGRIGLWGTSFSAGHVLTLAAEDPDIAAAVIQNPFVEGPATVAATLRSINVRNAVGMTFAYVRDEKRRLRNQAPYLIDVVGPPGSLAVFTTPDAEPGYRAILPEGADWTASIPARVLLRVLAYRPGKLAARVQCPLLACLCEHDKITPHRPARRVATNAPNGQLRAYPIGHFELFVGAAFEQVVSDQTAFFQHNLT